VGTTAGLEPVAKERKSLPKHYKIKTSSELYHLEQAYRNKYFNNCIILSLVRNVVKYIPVRIINSVWGRREPMETRDECISLEVVYLRVNQTPNTSP
jgi:hypothetical protein